jgi:hypothetical protein
MVDAEEFEPPLAEFPHQAHYLPGRNLVVPDRISREVLRRECLRDESVLPRQNSAAFPMRLAARMLQELSVYFAATSDGSLHFREYTLRGDQWVDGEVSEAFFDFQILDFKFEFRNRPP